VRVEKQEIPQSIIHRVGFFIIFRTVWADLRLNSRNDVGLIIPFKLESKRHLFSRDDIDRLKMIRGLIHEKGLNFAGVRSLMAMTPFWAIRKCSKSDRKSCGAYVDNYQPCWEASDKGTLCLNEECRDCKVYHSLDLESGIKSTLKTLI
jgi:hypothetical protein